MDVSALAAFIAGVISFRSPCVLPLVPGYVALLSGSSADKPQDDQGAARTAVMVN